MMIIHRKEIALSRGEFAIVDYESYEYLNQWKWFCHVTKWGKYAYRNIKEGNSRRLQIMHRLITDAGKGEYVDHRNGDGLDNRLANLRICTNAENARNSRKRNVNSATSKYKGVTWSKAHGKWIAQIKIDYKNIYLGIFQSERDAALAYNKAAEKSFGEFANINREVFL